MELNNQHSLLNAIKLSNEWYWDQISKSECVTLSENFKTASFFDYPITISRGTAGIRANKSLDDGVNYFEVQIKAPLYGTSIMIGVGTDQVCLHYDDFEYVNLVGNDSNSWGLNHKGEIWHNGISKKYCEPFFEKETFIGVLYNTHHKTLHFFINRVYKGLAFENVHLENKKLYAIMSSTARDVTLELVESIKLLYSLENLCCQNLTKICKNLDLLPISKYLIGKLKQF